MCVWLWMFGPPGVWNPAKKGLVGAITSLEIPKDSPILFCIILYLGLFSGFPLSLSKYLKSPPFTFKVTPH